MLDALVKDLRPWVRQKTGWIGRVSRFLGGWRFLFMPVGLFCLIAVGVHAAADTLDERILWVVDRADAAMDGLFGAFALTEGWVDWVDLHDRTTLARGLTLLWELSADLVLALPALGYREEKTGRPLRGFAGMVGTPTRRWREMFRDVVRRPTVLRVTRPLATVAVVLAGACAVARMVQGALYLGSRELIGDGLAGPAARIVAIGALVGVTVTFGLRAVLRNLQHADAIAEQSPHAPWLRHFTRGTVGSAIVVPLAVAAILGAVPLLSFFR